MTARPVPETQRTLEAEMAYGFSTLYILSVLKQLGAGHHTALDPYQVKDWNGVGKSQR
jgi:hypothetical protein